MVIRVAKFLFLIDFVVMHMEENSNIQAIMGRPFLVSSGALIDIHYGTITLRVKKENVTICALSLTNQSPQILRAKSSIRVLPINYQSSKVFPVNSDPPLSPLTKDE